MIERLLKPDKVQTGASPGAHYQRFEVEGAISVTLHQGKPVVIFNTPNGIDRSNPPADVYISIWGCNNLKIKIGFNPHTQTMVIYPDPFIVTDKGYVPRQKIDTKEAVAFNQTVRESTVLIKVSDKGQEVPIAKPNPTPLTPSPTIKPKQKLNTSTKKQKVSQ